MIFIIITIMKSFSLLLLLLVVLVDFRVYYPCTPGVLLAQGYGVTTTTVLQTIPISTRPTITRRYNDMRIATTSQSRLLPQRSLLQRFSNPNESEEATTNKSNTEIYQNVVAKFLSNFMTMSNPSNDNRSYDNNNNNDDDATFMQRRNEIMTNVIQAQQTEDYWNVPKVPKLPLDVLAQALDYELYHKEWFVTGYVNPIYFSSTNFTFQDPDVKMNDIRSYARGVQQIFDYTRTTRAEIISTTVKTKHDAQQQQQPHDDDDIILITCTWRLSGRVNIGPGLTIKPYIVYTDFTVCPDTGLIIYQRDRFDLPSWDILLSAIVPFLIGRITAPPAPKPMPRNLVMPDLSKYMSQ